MFNKLNIRVYKFILVGALNGALMGLIASYFMDYMVVSNSTRIFLTYSDWMIACVPTFAIVGTLINGIFAILMYEKEDKKGLKALFKK